MAYQYTDYSGISDAALTEEEKKRRQALAQGFTGGQGFGEIAGNLLQNRLDQTQQNLGTAAQMFENPQAAIQTRLGMTPEQANAEVKTQTVKTYGDGSQEHITKTQIPAPIAPETVQQVAQQPQQVQQVQQVQQPAVPVAPITQQAPVQQPQQVPQQLPAQGPINPALVQQPVETPQLPQPGPATQVAGPAQLPSQQAAAAPVEVPLEQQHHDAIIAAGNETDPAKRRNMFAQLLANKDVSEGNKTLANRLIAEDYLKQNAVADAERKIQEATPNDLARYMKERSKEGSYVKAILLARLGLTDLAQKEQELINPTLKMASATDDKGNKYTVERDNSGAIVRGFDPSGKTVGQEVLAKLSAAAMPTQSHLLPSVHGSPVVNAQGEAGFLMYDPQTQSSYVQVGNRRLPTAGWTTMAQNVQNVYNQAQASALGKGAGEGFTPQPMRPLPGTTATTLPGVVTTTPDENKRALERAQGDVAATDRQIVQLSRLPDTDPTKQQRISILQAEKAKAQQQVQQLSGAVQGLPAGAGTQTIPGAGIAQQKQNLEIEAARQKEGIQVAGARSQSFNKILDEEVRPQAQAGDTVVSTRKQQFQIFDRPGVDANKLFGLYNAAGEGPGAQKFTIIRDIFGGMFTPEAEVSQRLAGLDLTPQEKSALMEYNIANQRINAATLKQTAGPGSVSDAEQRANREANVDPTKIPALGAYNAMAQSQFSGDLARYKADWAESHPATNALQLDKAWRKEQTSLSEMYGNIAKKRSEYIASNGGTTAAVKEGYKRFPIPEYDPNAGTWKKTKPLSEILGR